MTHLLEAWRDSLLLQAEAAGILLLEEGSLQLGQGNHRPGEGSPRQLGDNRLLREGNHHRPGLGIRLPVGGNLLLLEGSRLLLVGSHLALEGSRLALEGSRLGLEGSRHQPVVGIPRTEEGILGSSFFRSWR